MPDFTIALLDDDPHYSEMLRLLLLEKCPWASVTCAATPRINHQADVYVIDNDFSGEKLGAQLALQAIEAYPASLVVVLSGTLERDVLKELVNCHASAVFDKADEAELAILIELIERYAALRTEPSDKPVNKSGLISSVTSLLAAWNTALSGSSAPKREVLK